ncbi:MAG: MBL fold metallo-hydrolase, partial [Chloroflexi bacterium]|nr:MBL fold metallo-hydrolase [Chloroflexota bacterium]
MKIGGHEVDLVLDGSLRFDGGAYFGVVPRVLWERQLPPDEKNRVAADLNCPLIRAGGKLILVDTGVGTKHPEKRRNNFAMDGGKLLESLRHRGVAPEDVDYLIFTHLHFDHAGGATYRAASGELRVTFPNAQHLAQRADWDEAASPNERSAAGYFEEDLEPIRRDGQLELLDGDTEILPGVSVQVTGGHTAGHQIVLLNVGGQTACFLGDLVPTTAHLPIAYTQGFDLYPLDVMEQKKTLLQQALTEQWLILFDHETHQKAGYLEQGERDRLRLRPVEL